jgi:hypothetical protein
MCELISGYQFPDGSLHFHADADVEAAWERAGKTEPICWADMVGHSGWRLCFGGPPAGAKEIEGLVYLVDRDLRLFAKLMKGAGYTSLVQRDAESVAGGRRLWADGTELCDEGLKLRADGNKLRSEGYKLWADGNKLCDKGDKLCDKGDKLCDKGDKLRAEGAELRAEGAELCFDITLA